MKNRQFLLILIISILVILLPIVVACGGESGEESEKPVTIASDEDYVWTYTSEDDTEIEIVIPKETGMVEVIREENKKDDDMEGYSTEECTPDKDKLLINFYVTTKNPPYTSVIRFNPKMKLEVKPIVEGMKLVYLDPYDNKCKPFPEDDLNYDYDNNTVTVDIEKWPSDPQVAWGF